MTTRTGIAVAVLTFVTGVVSGISGSRSSLFARIGERAPAVQHGTLTQASNVRGLLASLVTGSSGFVLTGVEDNRGRCNILVSATALRDDYMAVKPSQGPEFYLPYAAIYRIDREGPGPITIPVIYTTAHPFPKFCGD